MAIRTIPASFEYGCDCKGCDARHVQDHKATNDVPVGWVRLALIQHAVDFQGAAVGDASISRLLCPKHAEAVRQAINRAGE